MTMGMGLGTPAEEPAIADNICHFLLLRLQVFFCFHPPIPHKTFIKKISSS